jgi:hypothetical protein
MNESEMAVIDLRKKRHSFSLKLKIDILAEYEPGMKEKGFLALAKKYNTTTSTIRKWHMNKDKLLQYVNDSDVSTKVARRLKGCGRKHEHGELETILIDGVKDRNWLGLRIKDKYIALKTRELGKEMRLCDPDSTSSFKTSTGWQIPSNADDLFQNFQRQVQTWIDSVGIMDQVLRYYEGQPWPTIVSKGEKTVLMRK